MNPIERLHQTGQSIWLDYIRRDLIQSGELAELVAAGVVRGVTSNPTIFQQAIAGSDLYTSSIRQLAHAGWTEREIFDALAIEDVRAAAKVFISLYESTNGSDGFVSIEVNPELAEDTEETLREARRLWSAVNRPNLMIKIPATEAGLPAIEQAILEGINVNVTLIFSLERYAEVMQAYLSGLERRLREGNLLNHVASVASFFVSRVDSNVDSKLEAVLREEGPRAERAAVLLGQAAIANAKLAYAQFEATFSDERFQNLKQHGARVQRPLWASTSTKNPAYSDTYYVDNLIGPDTVNTIPPLTLEAFRDHGKVVESLQANLSAARSHLEALGPLGISMDVVTAELEREGVQKFANSYISVLKTIRERAEAFRSELGLLFPAVGRKLDELSQHESVRRIWEGGGGPRGGKSKEGGRSGAWSQRFDPRQGMLERVTEIEAYVAQARASGIEDVVLLSPRGLAGLVKLSLAIPRRSDGMKLHVLDSMNPDSISRISRKISTHRTLFLAVESGQGTPEVCDLTAYFLDRSRRRAGQQREEHFLLLAGEGGPLERLSGERRLRRLEIPKGSAVDLNSPVGLVGMMLAAISGINVRSLAHGAAGMMRLCGTDTEIARNPGAYLGAVLTAALSEGRDRLTFVADRGLEPLARWAGQVLDNRIVSSGTRRMWVITEPVEPPKSHSDKWLVVYLRSDGGHDQRMGRWSKDGVPVLVLESEMASEVLGAEAIRWELAAEILGLGTGDDMPVPDNRPRWDERTRDLMRTVEQDGALKAPPLLIEEEHARLWGPKPGSAWPEGGSLGATLAGALGSMGDEDVLIWRSHLDTTPSTRKTLRELRKSLWDRLGVVSILDEGQHPSCRGLPDRWLEGRRGVWLVVLAEPKKNLAIPGKRASLGLMHRAQALGEIQELLAMGCTVYGVDLASPKHLRDFTLDLLRAIDAFRVR